jgi:hypothetical protein
MEVHHTGLVEARADAAAVVLPSGEVVVFGGASNHSSATNTASSIHVVGGLRTDPVAALMPTPRAGLRAVLSEGKVFLIGGADASGSPLASVDVYDPATRTFSTSTKRLHEPRISPAVLEDVPSNRIYFAGGGQGPSDSIEVWSRQPFERLGLITGVPGGLRERPQLARAGSNRLYLHGDRAQPGVWIHLDDGRAAQVEHDLAVGGVALSSPYDVDAVLISGGRNRYGHSLRGKLQVLRADAAGDALREETDYGFSRSTEGATVLAAPEGIYTFGGTFGKERHPVDASEVVGPTGHRFLPPLIDATEGMIALRLEAHTILLIGGRGADGRPSHALLLIAPIGFMASVDGAFEAATAARAFSQGLDTELTATRAARDSALAALARLEAERRVAEGNLARLVADRTQLADAIVAARRGVAAIKAESAGLEGRLPGLSARVAQLQQRGASAQAQLGTAVAARNAAQQRLSASQASLASAQAHVRGLSGQIGAVNASIGNTQRSIAGLNAQIAARPTFQIGAVTNLAAPRPAQATGLRRTLLTSGGVGINRPTP